MSIQASSWAIEQRCDSPAEKAVLLVISSYAGPDGTCYPGQETISRQACCSVKSVERALKAFEERGWIERTPRRRSDGSRTSDLIWMSKAPNPESREQPDTMSDRPPSTRHSVQTNPTLCPNQPDTMSGLTTFEPLGEPSSVPDGTEAELSPDLDSQAWRKAVEVLRRGRLSDPKARSFFGKLLRDNPGLMARDLLPSLTSAQVAGTLDPQSYLVRAAKAVAGRRVAANAPDPTGWDDDVWAVALEGWRDDRRWSAVMGPEPGKPGCRAPPDLVAAVLSNPPQAA